MTSIRENPRPVSLIREIRVPLSPVIRVIREIRVP